MALLKSEKELDETIVWDMLKRIELTTMSENLMTLITKNGIKEITDIILKG